MHKEDQDIMATWIAHLRIAQRLLPFLSGTDETALFIGSIGPDCGVPENDGREFSPPVSVTHWTKTGHRRDSDSEAFFSAYLSKKKDAVSNSFYLGYYLHLISDIIWTEAIALPNAEEYQMYFDADDGFINEVKRDWYDQDRIFLKENPDFYPMLLLASIKCFPNTYLSYYPSDAFEKKLRTIKEFYGIGYDKIDREYRYLTERDMDSFVDKATDLLLKHIKKKGLL